MFRHILAVVVVAVVVLAVTGPVSAQDNEAVFGFGVDLHNSYVPNFFLDSSGPFGALGQTSLTPQFVASLRLGPALFLEPAIGLHAMGAKEEGTQGNTPFTDEITLGDFSVGIGGMWLLMPSETVSPYLRGVFDLHFLNAEEDEQFGSDSQKTELSATAFSIAGSLGGILNIKDVFFVTVEARLILAARGDIDTKITGVQGGSPINFTDTVDESASAFFTEMVVGVRALIF